MRTIDEPEKFKGLGEKVEKPKPAPTPPAPQGPYGLTKGEDGRLRTTRDNLPKIVPEMIPEADYDAWGYLP